MMSMQESQLDKTEEQIHSHHTAQHQTAARLLAVKCKDREKKNSPNEQGSTQMRAIILVLAGTEFISPQQQVQCSVLDSA